ncbi:MAG: hypothetical protein SGJ27_06710 [Candidatus Melainabacteria bacterium]|nr:hypothetical protein [Candidatus Melainabacteria bacterium]
MLIRIKSGLLVDHTEVRLVRKDTHSGGTKEVLEVVFRHPVTGTAQSETIHEQADIDWIYSKIAMFA